MDSNPAQADMIELNTTKKECAISPAEENDWIMSLKQTPLLNSETEYYEELINLIRQHVSANCVEVSDYFQDYDLLRTGCVEVSDFRKGLKAMGPQGLTETQMAVIEEHYRVPFKPDKCEWARFMHDVEKSVGDESEALTEFTTIDKKMVFGKILQTTSEDTDAWRSLQLSFQNFDKNKSGYVAVLEAEQCLQEIVCEDEMKVIEETYTENPGFNYFRFLQDVQGMRHSWKKPFVRGTISPQTITTGLAERRKHALSECESPLPVNTNRYCSRFSISYEFIVWSLFFLTTLLCTVDHFYRNGDVILGRSGKLPKRLWGTKFGETLTNVVWAVTARVIITAQNMMFYTTLWCFPNFLSEVAPRWLRVGGIRDVHLKMHRVTGIFLIAIPSLAHVLVIFVPPLIDGTQLKYYPPSTFNYSKSPDHLNWSTFWDPAAVQNWIFNDHRGVHLTADEIFRFVLVIVIFCFLFPLSRSEYLNNRSYSTAIALHVWAGIFYATDNIRKITHGLSHVFNLPVLIIWCIDRLLCIFVYRKCTGKIINKNVIGTNEYTVSFVKLNRNKQEPGVGDIYYLHHNQELFRNIVPQRAHPFTSFSNHGEDSSWDIGLIMTVMEDYEQWFLPWTNWLAPKEQVSLHVWGPYRSSVWQLHQLLLNSTEVTSTSSSFLLLASGSGFGYLLDVLGILAYKTNTEKPESKIKLKVDIHYSVRSQAFCKYFKSRTNMLLKKIKEKKVASVTFNCYVTEKVKKHDINDDQEQESEMSVFNCRPDFQKVLKTAGKNTFISFVGRPAIADELSEICEKKGLNLVKDYTNGQRGNRDRHLLTKYLKLSIWITLLVVVLCLLAHLFIDINDIKRIIQYPATNDAQNKTRLSEN